MRLMIAGTHSGCGKTTVSLALMAALTQRGLCVAPFKTGPDYIDPGFHRLATGRPSHNLDEHLSDPDTLIYLLRTGLQGADIGVIEGVMGYYDGAGGADFSCSSHSLARSTATPAVLVVDASGSAASAAATALGFEKMATPSGLCGVVVNRVSSPSHYQLVKQAIEAHTSLTCVGYLLKDAQLSLKSRHLGLVPAGETPQALEQIGRAARLIQPTIDWQALMDLAARAPQLPQRPSAPTRYLDERHAPLTGLRLGVAQDEAFSFYYQANLDLLARAGAQLAPFSPLRDERLPEGINGLYLGGGFPEVFARTLSDNAPMLAQLRRALSDGLPCYAECGGLLYLSRGFRLLDGERVPMVGALPVESEMTQRLQRFGYVYVTDRTGLAFPAHEFHHALVRPAGETQCAFDVVKRTQPEKRWQCGYERGRTLGGFPHLHFASQPLLMERLWSLKEES